MSEAEGPYTLNEDDAGRYVISDMPSHLATFESHLDASVAVLIANLAHHRALAAQADRVRQLENLLQEAFDWKEGVPCPWCKRDESSGHEYGCRLAAALTPPAKGETT